MKIRDNHFKSSYSCRLPSSLQVVAQVNSHFGGLYHSFIRHVDQWAEVISTDMAPLIRRLQPIMPQINLLTAANDRYDSEQARNALITARNALSREIFNGERTQATISGFHDTL